MVSRREWLGTSLGAGAALALAPEWLRALQAMEQQGGKLIMRKIPSSGEMIPIISFAPRPTAPPAPGPTPPSPNDVPAAKEVLKVFMERGGKVVDVLHGGPVAEQAAHTAANEMGVSNKLFWTTPLSVSVPVLPGYSGEPPKPDPAAVRAAMEEKFAAFKVPMIDLVMVSSGAEMSTHLAVLREMKKAGKVRYIGVHDLMFPPNMPSPAPPTARLESIIRSEQIDFVGTDYSVGDRRVEQTLLPLCLEKKVGFLAYFPFDRRRIFARASSTPLPAWAAEFDAKTWAQFFLKYVISHPAVVMARAGTMNPEHMIDDIGGGIGKLPNEAMRKRMAELVDSFPPTPPPGPPQQQQQPQGPRLQPPAPVVVSTDILDRYVGEYRYAAAEQLVTVRRDGERLFMKVQGNAPEGVLIPRSETRFQGPFGLVLDFQVDGSGKVTSAVVEQGPYRLPLERK